MARKNSANIAINGGFFDIGVGDKDGAPSGTLVIQGRVYNLQKGVQPLVVIKNGILSINQSGPENSKDNDISLVPGIPLLVKQGKIPEEIKNKKGEFYTLPQSRTALGITADGKVIIVLSEYHYAKDIMAITLGELCSFIQTQEKAPALKHNKQDIYNITLKELKQIIREKFSSQTGVKGLTILELAKLMQDLNCQYAVNLDGGSSSTLWIDGNVINNVFRDKDENSEKKIERPVSDAIIFKKKPNASKKISAG